jgi:hypothetical protein
LSLDAEWKTMRLFEREIEIPLPSGRRNLRAYFADQVQKALDDSEIPVRFAVTRTEETHFWCELGIMSGMPSAATKRMRSIFDLERRPVEACERFAAVLMVPTGIGAELGGHAGDAGAVTRLLAAACDTLITHPNVVNASDINELPENGLYVEGSVLCRLLMGTAGLQRVRSNRLLLVIDQHEEESYTHAAINSLNAARACYGLHCGRIVTLDPSIRLKAEYTSTGMAAGSVEGFPGFMNALERYRDEYDAVAISSVIEVPPQFHMDYFQSDGSMVNPWGGVEAIFTHAVSMLYDIPSAHSPMIESEEIEELDPGVVDPRMAAEAVSYTFLQSILKGLQRAPRIVSGPDAMRHPSVLTAADVSCLIIPDGCLGLPVLAALEQGIPVIAVRENRNLMRNQTVSLPWAPGQFHLVDNYIEAAGMLCALRAGVEPSSARRPFSVATVTEISIEVEEAMLSIPRRR